ncbi:MAG: hypothetical protein JO132_16930 [Streptosporangiaceae bacterium]|nr:hypothetical protein [Streptosporangiaceae bacterium]
MTTHSLWSSMTLVAIVVIAVAAFTVLQMMALSRQRRSPSGHDDRSR